MCPSCGVGNNGYTSCEHMNDQEKLYFQVGILKICIWYIHKLASCDIGRGMLIWNIAEILIYNMLSLIYRERLWEESEPYAHSSTIFICKTGLLSCQQFADKCQMGHSSDQINVLWMLWILKVWQHSEALVAYLEAVKKQGNTSPHVESAFPSSFSVSIKAPGFLQYCTLERWVRFWEDIQL